MPWCCSRRARKGAGWLSAAGRDGVSSHSHLGGAWARDPRLRAAARATRNFFPARNSSRSPARAELLLVFGPARAFTRRPAPLPTDPRGAAVLRSTEQAERELRLDVRLGEDRRRGLL